LIKFCHVPATIANSSSVFLQQPVKVLIIQTRQVVCVIKQEEVLG